MIKTLQKMDKEGTCLNKIKVIYDKPTANITLNGKKLKVFHLRAEIRLSSTVATFIQHSNVSSSHSDNFIVLSNLFFFLIISLSSVVTVTRIYKTMLNKSGNSG